jgi:hypothetical protein
VKSVYACEGGSWRVTENTVVLLDKETISHKPQRRKMRDESGDSGNTCDSKLGVTMVTVQ